MKKERTIRVGCRSTDFARAQTAAVVERLRAARPEATLEIMDLAPGGPDAALLDALGAGACDMLISAARTLPLEMPEGVVLAAYTQRTDPYDVLMTRDGSLLEDLPAGALLGVESPRVRVQIARFRDDLEIRTMAESLDQRYAFLEKGEIAGFIATAEDVEMLGWQAAVSEVFPPDVILPAAGQGSAAVLVHAGDPALLALGRAVDHKLTHQIIAAEFAFLRELHVDPTHPVAVHGHFDEEVLVLEALLADEISGAILRDDLDGTPDEGADLGVRLAKLILADGARDYLAGYR